MRHSARKPTKTPKIRSVKFNVLMNMLLTSSQVLFPLVTLPYVSRVLSTYGTGAVAFAQSVLTYFSMVALMGMQTYGVKACASVRDNPRELSRTVKELLVILLVTTTVVFAVYLAAVLCVPRFQENRTLFLLFGIGLWLASFGAGGFYQAIEQYGYIAARNIAFKFTGLVLMFVLVRSSDDYVAYGMIVLFTGYGMNVLNILRLRRLVDFSVKTKLRFRHHLKKMVWYAVAQVSSGMYVQTDIVSLGFIGTTNMVGLYQLVARIKNVLVQAVNSVGNVMLPRMSYYKAKRDDKAIASLVAKNINFIGVVSGMLIGGTVLCADSVVWIMGGPDFMESAVPLMAAVPAVLFSATNIMLGNLLITESKEKEWALVNLAGLAMSLVYAFTLIPLLGVLGAAMTNALTELTELIIRGWRSRRTLAHVLPETDLPVILAATTLATLAVEAFALFLPIAPGVVALLAHGSVFVIADLALLLAFRERFCLDLLRQAMGKLRTAKH